MANRIRELRKAKKMTMKQLGEAIDLAESTISQYETGKRQPDNATLCRLSDFFGVPIDYILGRGQGISYALLDGGEHFRIDDATHREIMEFAGYAKEQKKAPSEDEADLVKLTELFEKLSRENRKILLAAAKGLAPDK